MNNFVLLETNKFDEDNRQTYFFSDPLKIIACRKLAQVEKCLRQVESALANGDYAAGFISYEAGYAFEKIPSAKQRYAFPLLWFGIFKKPARVGSNQLKHLEEKYKLKNFKLNISPKEYFASIKEIRKAIERGETYQVNFTSKYKFNFSGSPQALYHDLKQKQRVAYSAFIKTPDFTVLSFSPELFFRKENNFIEVKPMKGTANRGKTLEEDLKQANQLKHSAKDRAENIMIVDLLRNDLGRIAVKGSIKTKKVYEIEQYETLHQMTSTISASLKPKTGIRQIFKNLFPSGSVSGAPKIKTMQIIKRLEKEERKIYTGAIGFITPFGKAVFNVAIRTLLLEKGRGEMGVGSGIVYDSDPAGEYDECKLKGEFLRADYPEFQLIETLRWESKKGFFLLKLHLNRLRNSARYFGFNYSKSDVLNRLQKVAARFEQKKTYKLRLLLSRTGEIALTYSELNHRPARPNLIKLSKTKISSQDRFKFHKTTFRQLYESERRLSQAQGFYDVIFQNEKEEITEGAISNIFIKKNHAYYTPPLKSGLLNGVWRQYFLARQPNAEEKVLKISDLKKADEIWLTNSLAGMVKCQLKEG